MNTTSGLPSTKAHVELLNSAEHHDKQERRAKRLTNVSQIPAGRYAEFDEDMSPGARLERYYIVDLKPGGQLPQMRKPNQEPLHQHDNIHVLATTTKKRQLKRRSSQSHKAENSTSTAAARDTEPPPPKRLATTFKHLRIKRSSLSTEYIVDSEDEDDNIRVA